ncbi:MULTISPECIES: beta-L-arabinofuranosidase domain-containing protein [unclassified Streptomyces]|uniref:glycoside hydrolase family 127 protein n=1 Tax=unclassified Streptomyces TaxID=2593676 RepID=UPI002E81ADD4|nr:beta-L-arabinofuranosidase domain-containing protein [Streptomyces sp. NBC_00589]WTI35928.1 glycoside hydrolase family 127 protein [Streptomyces sp. NBC_00775]WUB30398.1 glycoside hydrolase family 127 protein [Streptomyces sp. NBC_00589]
MPRPRSVVPSSTSSASSEQGSTPMGPVRQGPGAKAELAPATVEVRGGFWETRREVNARTSIPQGPGLLESAGNLRNLRVVAGTAEGEFQGAYPFVDSDVYKWLEAASWQLAQQAPEDDSPLAADVERIVSLVAGAQQPDGYLNTWFQLLKGGERYRDLRWGHELYCAGHLIQAAVAHHRATGRDELLDVAVKFADHIDSVFGLPGSGKPIDGVDGHPEVETALVELYRETGERRYLDLAGYFVDRFGHGLLGGEAYCQDRVPLREATTVEGHAVRQLYLLAAAADLATETGEAGLRTAAERLWAAMTTSKTHITGGLGAHHDEEDFGDPYELPNERAYCETCAAIASIQWSWRMALLTGEARYSDLIERTLYNGFLAGVSLDGERWLYVNPLQVRDGHTDTGGDQSARRTRWFRCACCPPNVMRLLASLEHYLASHDAGGLQIHQYVTGRYTGDLGGTPVVVSAETDYPWHGTIALTVEETPADRPWTLSLRIPQWCGAYRVRSGDTVYDQTDAPVTDGWLRLERTWAPGDRVVLELGLEPRLTAADPRVDAVRGCVAIERGPLVYCLEEADHPGGGLDDMVLDTGGPLAVKHRPDLLGGVTTVVAAGHRRHIADAGWWPYRTAGTADAPPADAPLELTAIPYYAWANRQDGSMRVWLPTS